MGVGRAGVWCVCVCFLCACIVCVCLQVVCVVCRGWKSHYRDGGGVVALRLESRDIYRWIRKV